MEKEIKGGTPIMKSRTTIAAVLLFAISLATTGCGFYYYDRDYHAGHSGHYHHYDRDYDHDRDYRR
jgi:hypothetical protein